VYAAGMNIQQTAILSVFTILLISSCARGDEKSPSGLHWVDTPGEHLELQFGNDPIVRYMYSTLDESSPETRQQTYKPYLHVFEGNGRALTKGPGGLYPHHRGIYFGFNKITYGDGKKCDTWHCTGKAYQSHQEFVRQDVAERNAHLEVIIHWHGIDGEAFAKEQREMRITPTFRGVQIDFASRLEPIGVEKIHLDGDPQHAGVQFRASQHVAEKTKGQTYYLRADGKGKPGETRNWNHQNKEDPLNEECVNRPWNAMSIVIDEQRHTVLYIDHPDNPKPARYSERDYGRFGSYFVADATIKEPLEVRYRFIVGPGEMTIEECQKFRDEFVEAN
ncbi:MAG: DUF6807 family protein, partial [Aeoliella sp.]